MIGAGALSPRILVHLLLIRPFIRLVLGLTVTGRDHLSGEDQFILAANHNSHLDAFLLLAAIPARSLRRTRPVAAADHFSRNPVLFRIVEWLMNPVWVDRKGGARRSLSGMEEWLAAGGSLIIFPEGTRGRPGKVEKFREGLGAISARFPEIPILPAWLSGPEKSLPRRTVIPVPVWNSLMVGPPRRYTGKRGEITAAVRRLIEELSRRAPGAIPHPDVRPATTLAVLGIDGSGKSTLARSLARALSTGSRTCHVGDRLEIYEDGEEVEFQPLPSERARRVLSERAKKAGSLKSYKVPKLAELLLRDHLLKEARTWYRPASVILDGSPLLNLAAWAGMYRDEPPSVEECAAALDILTSGGRSARSGDPIFRRYPELSTLAGMGMARFDMPDAVIFLDTPPAVALERIGARGEPLQAHESRERLNRLQAGYLLVGEALCGGGRVRFLRIDGRAGRDEVLARAVAFAGEKAEGPTT